MKEESFKAWSTKHLADLAKTHASSFSPISQSIDSLDFNQTEWPKSTAVAPNALKRVESERDKAWSDLHCMTIERDSLRERLRAVLEKTKNERAYLEQRIQYLQNTVLKLEQERAKQSNTNSQMRQTITRLERDISSLGKKFAASEEEVSSLKNECNMLSVKSSQLMKELSETQQQHTSKNRQLTILQEKNKKLNDSYDSLTMVVTTQNEELHNMHENVSKLENDRKALQEQLDIKSELLTSALKHLEDKENIIKTQTVKMKDHQTIIESLRETVSTREDDLVVAARKLFDIKNELLDMMKVKDAMLEENAKLKEELDQAQISHQALQLKLDEESQEINALKRTVENYVSAIMETKNLLSAKNMECNNMQESWQQMFIQAQRWEKQAKEMEAEMINLRMKLDSLGSDKLKLEEKAEDLENSLQKVLSSEVKCNAELVHLNRTLEQQEDKLQWVQDRHSVVQCNLEKTRELCVTLEADKQALQQEIIEYRSELKILHNQLTNEQAYRRALENMMASAHENELERQCSYQDKLTEIQFLRDKLLVAQNEVRNQSREVERLSSQTAELMADLDSTRKHLSTDPSEK